MRRRSVLQAALIPVLAGCAGGRVIGTNVSDAFRVATYNTSLFDPDSGGLIRRLRNGDEHAQQVASVIRRVRPDLLLLNEFDYDAAGEAADLFQRDYLQVAGGDDQPLVYQHRYLGPVNTGLFSGLDLNGDGVAEGGEDCWGYGTHPGQYGMLVLSRFPLLTEQLRSFQHFRWSQMPGAQRPHWPDGRPYHAEAIWQALRLSSKNHWDLPVQTPLGIVHFLVSHPTPPVFDGPENRNGCRNHDELRLWADYLDPSAAGYLVDDQGRVGGIDADARVIIAGDLNADPLDGAANDGIALLLKHPRLNGEFAPRSAGALQAAQSQAGANSTQRANPATDTADFGDEDGGPGNMRVDYVIPSKELPIKDGGVFWPEPDRPGADWLSASDHRMVWMDLQG